MVKFPTTLLVSALLLSSCAGGLRHAALRHTIDVGGSEAGGRAPACGAQVAPEQDVKLRLIRELMDSGKHHAALAHLDASGLAIPPATYLRAELLRQIGRAAEAVPLYKGLLGGCLAGSGYHGLGLLAGHEGRTGEAIEHLSEARRRLPTDPRVRNDLGYALLLDRQHEAARHEFITALELDEHHRLAAMNMALLLFVEGQERGAEQWAKRMRISAEEQDLLRAQAQKDKAHKQAPTAKPAAKPHHP
jgi:Flp pilus assembly protein TadD, contains TPR repeats